MNKPSNLDLALALASKLKAVGLENVVTCAGSFNSPLLAAFKSDSNQQNVYHFEERTAAFFAMGWSKISQKTTVLCVTSGTAVAECLPAVIEAYFSNCKLIIISADRENKLSDTGYPQAINQTQLLSAYCKRTYDIKDLSDVESIKDQITGPVHINIRFSEPILVSAGLIDTKNLPYTKADTRSEKYKSPAHQACKLLSAYKRPLFIVDKIPFQRTEEIESFLAASNAPVLAEARSLIRESDKLKDLIIKGTEKVLKASDFDLVVRIGDVPSFNLWRSLERQKAFSSLPVINFCNNPDLPGLSRETLSLDITDVCFSEGINRTDPSWVNNILQRDRAARQKIDRLLNEYPLSEASFIRSFSQSLKQNSFLYLGNSLPIREWNEFADFNIRHKLIDANRGANGIDGQISSFLGACHALKTDYNFCLIGDLTFLYDCNSLSLIKQLSLRNCCLVVINNSGGQIFQRLEYFESLNPSETDKNNFLNCHSLSAAKIAGSFGLNSIVLDKPTFPADYQGIQLIEIVPDKIESHKFNSYLNDFFEGPD